MIKDFEDLEVVTLLTEQLEVIRKKVEQGRSGKFKIKLKNNLKIQVQILYNADKDKFKIQIQLQRPSDTEREWVDCKYVIDGPHCFFNEYLCSINKMYCCVSI